MASNDCGVTGNVAVGAVLHAELHVQQAQEVVELGQRRHRRLAAAARGALLDRHRRRDAVDRVDVRAAGGLHDGARVRVQRLEVAPLAFVEEDVERQRRLARARDPGDHREGLARDLDVDRLQVVLARVDDLDRRRGSRAAAPAVARPRVGVGGAGPRVRGGRLVDARPLVRQRGPVRLQFAPGVRALVADQVVRRADGHDFAAAVAAFRAEVDQPVGRGHHVHVVLDDHERVPGGEQLAEGAHQPGDVVEVQAGRRLVEQEQRAAGRRLAARRLGEEAGELQALRLAARQRRDRLSELHVLEADVGERRQHARDFAILGEERERFADRHARARRRRSPACRGARPSPPAFPAGSACRRSPGSAGRRRTGTASRRARSRCRRRSGNGRRPS